MGRVGINGVVLTPQSGGILNYISNLIDSMLLTDTNISLKLFFSHDFLEQEPHFSTLDNAIGLPLSGTKPRTRILREPFIWPREIRRHQIDLFHSPISYIPLGISIPAVVTIHDLGAFHFPEYYTRLRAKFLQHRIAKAARNALKIIAISEYTKNDIVETLDISPDQIECIHHGFNPRPFQVTYPDAQISQIRSRYKLPEKYILSVGHLEPRKNYLRLIQAFHDLREQEKIAHHLVIVGQENWFFAPFYELMRQLKLEDVIHFTGFVDQPYLPAIYQMADVFILPTLFEGFGIPVLESMAAGTPVLCSNITSMPEVCQDAALYFNPYEVGEIGEKLRQIVSDSDLKFEMIQRGRKNIERFKWEECAQKTLNLYRELMNE